jgi:hypothetical protein
MGEPMVWIPARRAALSALARTAASVWAFAREQRVTVAEALASSQGFP